MSMLLLYYIIERRLNLQETSQLERGRRIVL